MGTSSHRCRCSSQDPSLQLLLMYRCVTFKRQAKLNLTGRYLRSVQAPAASSHKASPSDQKCAI